MRGSPRPHDLRPHRTCVNFGPTRHCKHSDDVVCLAPQSTTRCRYLPKFKWDALTEEINYQRAVREQRLVAEISAAKRERDFYLSRWDTGQRQSGARDEGGGSASWGQRAWREQRAAAGYL